MAETPERQPKFAQRKRIFPHREQIYRYLDDGYPVGEIRALLDLSDIPLRTFEKNVAALRKERTALAGVVETITEDAAPTRQPVRSDPPKAELRAKKKKGGKAIVHPDFALPKGREAKSEDRPTLKPKDYM